jgi:hypothetical protein
MLNAYFRAVVSTVQASQQEPMEEENDGLDIQSISVVKEAEFIFNKIDEGKSTGGSGSNTTPEKKRTINLEAFKIIRVIGKGVYVVQFAWTLCQLRTGLHCVGHACCKVLLLVLVLCILSLTLLSSRKVRVLCGARLLGTLFTVPCSVGSLCGDLRMVLTRLLGLH